MNSVPEETPSKKMRKRSRRKNKSGQNSFRSVGEEEKTKIKTGCRTGSDHSKPAHRPSTKESKLISEPPKSTVGGQAPPNTGQFDASDSVLLKILEKGRKLRDAMVLSVLADTEADLLKFEQPVKEKATRYKPVKTEKSGEMVTPREEKLITDYLEGKAMKEEEEILVLNTLHSEGKDMGSEPNVADDKQQEACCLSMKTSCPHSTVGKNHLGSDNTSGIVTHVSSCIDDVDDSLIKRINCFRLTIDSLSLTDAGWRKINQAARSKRRNCEMGTVPPPGATYFVECHFVEESPRTEGQLWKASPLRFCSRRQIEQEVYFGQSSAHSLRPPHSPASTRSELAAARCLVCWRHLHQRVPALLGHFSLAGVLSGTYLRVTATLPVTTDSDVTVAHLRLTLELGRDKLYFGRALLGDVDNQQTKPSSKVNEEDKSTTEKDYPLNMKDLCSSSQETVSQVGGYNENTRQTLTKPNKNKEMEKMKKHGDTPVCSRCGRNVPLTDPTGQVNSLPCPCSNLPSDPGVFIKVNSTKGRSHKERRNHVFLIGIDSVIGFPLFGRLQDELDCYVVYKFPEIISGLKVELARSETTSRVVPCEPQPSLTSVNCHTLALPVVQPLSPLLASCSSGIKLGLWLRYYKPTPHDHMVALAMLPMEELCLMELEFDKTQQQSAVTKVLKLPLALVPSSITAPLQQHRNHGVLRISITYSNHVVGQGGEPLSHLPFRQAPGERETAPYYHQSAAPVRNVHTLPSFKSPQAEPITHNVQKWDTRPIEDLLTQIDSQNLLFSGEDSKTVRNQFWSEPFRKHSKEKKATLKDNEKHDMTPSVSPPTLQKTSTDFLSGVLNNDGDHGDPCQKTSSLPVMKEDFYKLEDNLEQRFNRLQSDLLKERKLEMTEVINTATDSREFQSPMNDSQTEDCLSLSSNSSMDSLPFILGPPADFTDVHNTVFSTIVEQYSDSPSEISTSNTITGFLKEDKDVVNLGSNESFEGSDRQPGVCKPQTFKAKIKVDRAVNLKAVKAPCNGKKGKVAPSSWVSFGTGECCEQNCGTGGLVCSGRRFVTPVVRRNYNPVWNLAWDVDLPVEYLQQVNKRLVFRVFEENLEVCLGFASANLSILTSGLPCLSSWLSINDLAGACKGQIKIVVTPLEDVSQYQECSVFDLEEDEFEDPKENKMENGSPSPKDRRVSAASFIASETEVFLNEGETGQTPDEEVAQLTMSLNVQVGLDSEDLFSADDVISDYKNTLENNFRNEMAGLENLIKFLRVGSASNELSFFEATENKENLSSNPTNADVRTAPSPETGGKATSRSSLVNNEMSNQHVQRDRVLIDASTETTDKDKLASSSSNQQTSEDILSKLLQQISMFQLPTVKITDNTSQTVVPETTETFTETSIDNETNQTENQTVHMKDASTETDDICDTRSSQTGEDSTSQPHVCGEIASVLLNHFLTCKPAAVKVTDGSSQTTILDVISTADSSGVFVRSQPSGMSSEILKDILTSTTTLSELTGGGGTNSERLTAIDNNIKDLERFLMEAGDRGDVLSVSREASVCGSLDSVKKDEVGNGCSSSDMESSESCSQALILPRETPDGGNTSTLPRPVDTGTILKRRGTFVIEVSNSHSSKGNVNKEDGGDGPVV